MSRYIPATTEEKKELLKNIGVESIEELFNDIPQDIRDRSVLKNWDAMSEIEIYRKIAELCYPILVCVQ